MAQTEIILLVPEKTDEERDRIVNTWQQLGGSVERLAKFWQKPAHLEGKRIAIYGNDTFAMVVAQVFSVQLISPDDSLIARLSQEWTKRLISIKAIGALTQADFPRFIKPLIPKQFKAKMYQSLEELLTQTEGLDHQTQVLLSEIVEIAAEARGFVHTNKLMDIALYEGSADIKAGASFLVGFINTQSQMPTVYVVDIGYNTENGWFIIEFNACWGAGLNGCSPEKVIDCIIEATNNN